MAVEHSIERGEVVDGHIRYVLMRPDVLMGAAKRLATQHDTDFLAALEASAYENAQASFTAYRESGRFEGEDFLASSGAVAAMLGWGVWSTLEGADGEQVVEVANSPFAAGYGSADRPVCSPITGVLRAIAWVGYGEAATVTESACAAQGAPCCRFHVRPGSGAKGA